ncbi:hypothetical protein [Clostridium lacusfryxellense]|uniref:hypothetical protein n=1 Tax=Clostridium lacusfryxellense TaxID=205328 RepID=UPI001C0B9BA0|nr:hypothetical protein [Clostridium lacusfryxellense]MBU3114531.1 hypothetical protein [Clostridium lacusfryxellense]
MKKIFFMFLICAITLSTYGCGLNFENKTEQETLDFIARPDMNAVEKNVDNWYLFYNDRIYVYLFDPSDSTDSFFSTDLNGNDKKIISQSEDLRFAELYLIYDNYAYYYTTYNQGIKKINIETGKIYNVIDGKYLYLIPDTLKDGKAIVEYENNNLGEAHVYVAKLDLKSGILSDEKILPFVGTQLYYYSGESNKVYCIKTDYDNNNNVYEDNSLIYTYPSSGNDNDFVFTQDNYIFVVTTDKIIKLDINNKHTIIGEKPFNNHGYTLYTSIRARNHEVMGKVEHTAPICALAKPFVYSKDNTTYRFNSQTMEFKKIGDVGTAFIQKINSYIIFQQGALSTTVYDESTGKVSSFSSSNFGVDDKSIYIMSYDGDYYYQTTDKCDFRVKKIDFE